MSSSYILYSSEGCHLCEDALALCTATISNEVLVIVDIVADVDDEKLVELYGVHIPVLKQVASNKVLFWPFSSEDVIKFIHS